MKKLSEILFGANLYRMPKASHEYGDRMEYTQIETISVGTIPVFDKHWGENNKTKDGKRYIDIPYSAIYSDKENLDKTTEELMKVANDVELQKKYRETSYEIVKKEFNADVVLPVMFDHILKTGKDENKYKSDEEMILEITQNEEYLNEFNKLKSEGHLVSMGIRELTQSILCIVEIKKEVEIKRWKSKVKYDLS
jgi:hypothetical protein